MVLQKVSTVSAACWSKLLNDTKLLDCGSSVAGVAAAAAAAAAGTMAASVDAEDVDTLACPCFRAKRFALATAEVKADRSS